MQAISAAVATGTAGQQTCYKSLFINISHTTHLESRFCGEPNRAFASNPNRINILSEPREKISRTGSTYKSLFRNILPRKTSGIKILPANEPILVS
jgi:hypothetical protein